MANSNRCRITCGLNERLEVEFHCIKINSSSDLWYASAGCSLGVQVQCINYRARQDARESMIRTRHVFTISSLLQLSSDLQMMEGIGLLVN